MVRTFQLTKALNRMTVMENMRLGAAGPARREPVRVAVQPPVGAARRRRSPSKAEELLARFKLDTKKRRLRRHLSGGQRKLLEMARALMSDPKMIMLDEPMAGVNPALTQSLLGHIQACATTGMTVLFVEHDMHMVRHISDWVVVMAEGRIVAEGPPDAVMDDQAVIDAYLGAHHDTDLGDDALLDDASSSSWPRRSQMRRPSASEKRRALDASSATGRDRGQPVRRGDRPRRRLPARGEHPQRLQPGRLPRRAHRHHRPERRRQVDAAQGPVRPGATCAPAP